MAYMRIIIFLMLSLLCGLCKAQDTSFFDSALISRKIDEIAGTWYYGNKGKDTVIIKIEKHISRDSLSDSMPGLPMALAWIYYKRNDSVAELALKKYAPDKYTWSNRTMIGTYLDYMNAVVLNYKDTAFQWLSHVVLTYKNKRKLYWEVKHKLDERNRRYNFMYPEKLVLRRMKKRFP